MRFSYPEGKVYFHEEFVLVYPLVKIYIIFVIRKSRVTIEPPSCRNTISIACNRSFNLGRYKGLCYALIQSTVVKKNYFRSIRGIPADELSDRAHEQSSMLVRLGLQRRPDL